jgi:nucleotide-binding universal stress UspA family protein
MFKNPFEAIVVGVDFSDYSKVVVKQAQKLALLWKAKLVVVHAFNEPVDYAPNLYVSLRKSLGPQYYKDRIKKFYGLKTKSFESIVDFSSPAKLIQSTAKKNKNSLIVVGYQGHSRLTEFLFGSTAQSLALSSKFPDTSRFNKSIQSKYRIFKEITAKFSDHVQGYFCSRKTVSSFGLHALSTS